MITGRQKSFDALNEIIQGKDITIVETGAVRGLEEHSRMGDGWSSYHWFKHLENTNSTLDTVDIDKGAIEKTAQLLQSFPSIEHRVNLHIMDSIEFLKQFDKPIDLLFLDSFDYAGDAENIKACHQHSLNEVLASEDKLKEDSLILIDDVFNNTWDGKGKLSIPYMLANNYELIHFLDSQVLLRKL